MLREQETLAQLAQQRMEETAALQAQTTGVASTAEMRPNAYIPEALGIPKPYGTSLIVQAGVMALAQAHAVEPLVFNPSTAHPVPLRCLHALQARGRRVNHATHTQAAAA